MVNIDEESWKRTEYEQVSDDWRHRDVLTWQLPAVMVVVGGVLVAEALGEEISWPIRNVMLLFAFALAVCLTLALKQNLKLQEEGREIAKCLYPQTQRFDFRKKGSRQLLVLSLSVCVFLGIVFLASLLGSILPLIGIGR